MGITLAFVTRAVKEDVIPSYSKFTLKDPKAKSLATGVRKDLKEAVS